MNSVWTEWPWSRLEYRQAARTMIDSDVAFTHPVGMAVHDVGDYKQGPLQPGLVFALDPQMWIPDEQLYIRVEDTVVVTSDGRRVAHQGMPPLELEAIESVMRHNA